MKPIIIHDSVFGIIKITEPVIIKLIQSPSMQRLKDIDHAGYFQPLVPHKKHTRFEHSIGVYWLLHIHHAPLEEQIAGLIHDVSHGVFSHCLDYALAGDKEGEQSHQDNIFETFVLTSEIPSLVKTYGFDIHRILDDTLHPLKETTIPDLCADRIDYSLRSAIVYAHTPKKKIQYILDHLTVKNTLWIFTDYKSAKLYAELFYLLNTNYYSGFPSAVMFRTVGNTVSYALHKKYLTHNDLYKTDTHVLSILMKIAKKDPELYKHYQLMINPKEIRNNPSSYDVTVICKSRIVDPFFISRGKILRVSKKNPKWNTIVQKELMPKKYFLKFPEGTEKH